MDKFLQSVIFFSTVLYLPYIPFTLHNQLILNTSRFMMSDYPSPKKPQRYADSSISDKAFKRGILWFLLYCSLFCIGVIFAVGADLTYIP